MKRAKKITLGFSYVISFFVVVGGTILLVKLAQGNVLDLVSGKLRPTGLLLADSKPQGGVITLNGKKLKVKTPRRITAIDPGPITVSYTKPGYRVWHNTNQIVAGQVTFLTYAWLLPQTIPTGDLLKNLHPIQSLQTSDRKRTVFATASPTISLYTTTDFSNASQIYAPPATAADPATVVQKLELVKISDNGSNVLARQTLASGATEFVLIDTGTSRTPINLTQLFKIGADAQLSFNPDNANQLYWFEAGAVRIVDAGSRHVSSVIADQLISFAVATNKKLYYIQPDKTTRSLFSTDLSGNHKSLILAGIEASPSYVIDAVHFSGADFVALYVTGSSRLNLYSNTSGDNFKVGSVLENVSRFSFNHLGQFLAVDQANKLTTLDLEKNIFHTVGTDLANTTDWLWLDDYHLSVADSSGIRLMDYDGQNDEHVADIIPTDHLLSLNHNPVINHITTTGKPSSLTELVVTEKP